MKTMVADSSGNAGHQSLHDGKSRHRVHGQWWQSNEGEQVKQQWCHDDSTTDAEQPGQKTGYQAEATQQKINRHGRLAIE